MNRMHGRKSLTQQPFSLQQSDRSPAVFFYASRNLGRLLATCM